MRNKIIQVPIPADLLESLDSLTRKQGKSRSAVIREACAQYITALEEAEEIRRYIQSYEEDPENPAMGLAGAELAAENWGEEDWSDEYAKDLAEADAAG